MGGFILARRVASPIDYILSLLMIAYLPEPLNDYVVGMVTASVGRVALPIAHVDITKAAQ